jgi:hypothetical protein
MGYNARNDEIRDNITRMRREWEAQRNALATVRPIQRNTFSQRLCLVLAEDRGGTHIKTSLARYQLRQLRHCGGLGLARKAT